jgi:Caspase domain
VSAGAERYIAAAIAPDKNSALALDRRGAVVRIAAGGGRAAPIGEAPGQIRIAGGATALLGLDEAGRAGVINPRGGNRLARIISARGGWVVLDGAGRYDGSRGGLAATDWAFDAAAVPIDSFAERYFEPGVLGRVWAGGNSGARQAQALEEGVPVPPSVQIVLADDVPKVGGQDFQVVVLANAGGAPIAGLRMFHNGRALPANALVQSQDVQGPNGMVRAASFMTRPSAGLNTFSAVAETDDGVDAASPRVTERFSGAQPAATLHVLAVGVDQYGGGQNGGLPNLNFAAADAASIADQLGRGQSRAYARVNVTRLINAQASRAAILASLRQLAASAGPDDAVVLYLAGHGLSTRAGQWSYGAFGAERQRVEATGVSSVDIEEALRPSRVRRVAIMIDACFAGAGAGAFASQRATYQRVLADVSRAAGLTIIAAARDDAAALELRSLGHGAFTYAVLQALAGGADVAPRDGSVSVLELADSIEKSMGPLAQRNAAARQEARVFSIGADFPLR